MSARRNPDTLWCILSTSGGRTLPLARSLANAGLEVWTPKRTIRRPAPGQRRRLVMGQRRKMIEVDVAILPGFVFARAVHLDDLAAIAHDPAARHPAFTVFQLGGRVPMVSDASVAGLREEEAAAAAVTQALRDHDQREEARRLRAEQMRTERARRAALRRERRDLAIGARVEIDDMPSMAGMVGRVIASTGTAATIDFGGAFPMQVEAWRVIPSALSGEAA
jgi:hypothetical protein